MSSVWVVTEGSYSDYHICCIFSSRQLAENFIKKAKLFQKYSDYNDVEEYEINIEEGQSSVWEVWFRVGGNIDCYFKSDQREEGITAFTEDTHNLLKITVKAETEESAIKIACDKRAEYLAQKEGV